MLDVRPIRNDDDLAWAIGEVSAYFDHSPASGSADADRFDVLSDLIEVYESRAHPVSAPDPIDLIVSFMEMTGRTQADLAELLNSRPRASEIIRRKRTISLEMIRKLHEEWGLPADCLIARPHLTAA
jgi:HTH-type transcriptional regulator / antitoxin HigA